MSVRLSELNLASLQNRTDPNRWGIGTARDRHLYSDEKYWYKIWGKDFLRSSLYVSGTEYKGIGHLRQPHGFEVGLFPPHLSKGFVCFIEDDEGLIRGYVTKAGKISDYVPSDFAKDVFDSCIRTGWVFSDLGNKNVVIIDGQHSLIDFDTHLVSLEALDIAFEEEKGCLRPHVSPEFRALLRKYIASI